MSEADMQMVVALDTLNEVFCEMVVARRMARRAAKHGATAAAERFALAAAGHRQTFVWWSERVAEAAIEAF